jgi:endonuclease/exonuclease/phosphatase family metal-dependent hydrolase
MMDTQQEKAPNSRPPLFRKVDGAKASKPSTPGKQQPRGWRRVLSISFATFVWLYFVSLLAIWAVLYFYGDDWWLATIMLYGPRWVCGLPLLVLLPIATVWRRRLLIPLAVGTVIVVWPIMGLCLPWARITGMPTPTLRLLTCNLKGRCDDNAVLNDLIFDAAPDVVTLQGCNGNPRIRWPEGWHFVQKGELLVASRYPVREVTLLSGPRLGHVYPRPNVYYCLVSLPQGDAAFCSVHLPSPHYGLAEALDRHTVISPRGSRRIEEETEDRRRQAETAVEMANEIHVPLILAGDFNMTADSPTYRQTWAVYGNAFSRSGFGFGHTERPFKHGSPFGIRIDHVLYGPDWQACRCWVGPELGSDHLPVIADLALKPAAGHN